MKEVLVKRYQDKGLGYVEVGNYDSLTHRGIDWYMSDRTLGFFSDDEESPFNRFIRGVFFDAHSRNPAQSLVIRGVLPGLCRASQTKGSSRVIDEQSRIGLGLDKVITDFFIHASPLHFFAAQDSFRPCTKGRILTFSYDKPHPSQYTPLRSWKLRVMP